MTDALANIAGLVLARGDDSSWVNLIPIGVVVLLWVAGAVASATKGSTKTSPAPRPKRQSRPPPLTQAIKQQQRPAKSKKTRGGRATTQPQHRTASSPRRNLESSDPFPASRPQVAATVATGHGAPAGIDAAQIRRWLTPQVMRQQFILTEVFDPPPALRED